MAGQRVVSVDSADKLLAIDVGNTNLVVGIFEGETLKVSWRLATLPDRTADELWVLLGRLLANDSIEIGQIKGVVLSSVVPPLTRAVDEMISRRFECEALRVDATNAGLPIRYENPEEVGADRLVNGVAAQALYGVSTRSVIVVDFGTATTFDCISGAGEYLGGVICPGIEISAEALFRRAARLPKVDVRRPAELIGRTTVGSMQSGLFYGYVAMVEGLVARLRDELASDGQAVCVATGGLASAITSEISSIDHVNSDLTLTGLRLVWERNQTGH